jgi:hypothetical protein
VNTSLKVLIMGRCGVRREVAAALQHAVTHKPVLTWADRKAHAAEALGHLSWLKEALDKAKYPFRVDTDSELSADFILKKVRAADGWGEAWNGRMNLPLEGSLSSGISPQARSHGRLAESSTPSPSPAACHALSQIAGSRPGTGEASKPPGEAEGEAAVTAGPKAPSWMTSSSGNLLKELLATPVGEMEGWGVEWLEDSLGLLLLYLERLEPLRASTEDELEDAKDAIGRVRGHLGGLLLEDEAFVSLLAATAKAEAAWEAAHAELLEGRGRVTVLEGGVTARREVLARTRALFQSVRARQKGGEGEGEGEGTATLTERVEVQGAALKEAGRALGAAREEVTALAAREGEAREALAKAREDEAALVRELQGRQGRMHEEALSLLWRRLWASVRAARVQKLYYQTDRLFDATRKLLAARLERRAYLATVPVSCGFEDLDEFVRKAIK